MDELIICKQEAPIFWTIQNIKDIVYILAAFVTIFLAIRGFNRWKIELRGKAYFDFAYKFLKVTYGIRDALHDQRSVFFNPAEIGEVPGIGYEEAEDKATELDRIERMYKNRLQKVSEAAKEFNSLQVEGEALLGKQFREKAQKVVVKLNVYKLAIEQHINFKSRQIYKSHITFEEEKAHSGINAIIHRQGGKGEDAFGDSIERLIEELNSELVKYIRKQDKRW